jgi:hypothetical protein
MKIFIIILVVLCVSGCGLHAASHSEYSSAFNYSLDQNSGWRVFQHKKNDWGGASSLNYFKDNFSTHDMWIIDRRGTRNTFFAEYQSIDAHVIVYVATDGYAPRKGVASDIGGNVLYEVMTEDPGDLCKICNVERVTVAFNAVAVDFDSSSVKFEVNGIPQNGEEIVSYFNGKLATATTYPHDTYNLTTLKGKTRFEPVVGSARDKERFNHPTFTYRFHMTCQEMENSVFVLDGLAYKGKQIPPLRVRLNYYEPSKVPAYVGPQDATNGDGKP